MHIAPGCDVQAAHAAQRRRRPASDGNAPGKIEVGCHIRKSSHGAASCQDAAQCLPSCNSRPFAAVNKRSWSPPAAPHELLPRCSAASSSGRPACAPASHCTSTPPRGCGTAGAIGQLPPAPADQRHGTVPAWGEQNAWVAAMALSSNQEGHGRCWRQSTAVGNRRHPRRGAGPPPPARSTQLPAHRSPRVNLLRM